MMSWDDLSDEYGLDGDRSCEERVLVAVVTRPRDWDLVQREHWYRIPLARAPRRIAADYLAFYLGGKLGALRWTIPAYAPIIAYRIQRRCELLADEPDHPRAGELYHKLELGPLVMLPQPIPSAKLRRVTFIPTTLAHLLQAHEINDLWDRRAARDHLWRALQAHDIRAYREYHVSDTPGEYIADLAVPCLLHSLGVLCAPEPLQATQDTPARPVGQWVFLHLAPAEILTALPTCVARIAAFVRANGGQPQD